MAASGVLIRPAVAALTLLNSPLDSPLPAEAVTGLFMARLLRQRDARRAERPRHGEVRV